MNPQDLSAYITSLLRSEPEVIASFFMGVLITGVVVFGLVRRGVLGRDSDGELSRKDAEIARKDTEVARKDAQIARLEARLEASGGVHQEKDGVVGRPRADNAVSTEGDPSLPAMLAAAHARCADLEAECRHAARVNRSLDQTVEELRAELARVSGELAHAAKWLRVFEEENARLAEEGPLTRAEPDRRSL